MKILNRLDEILGMIAKSSISDGDYKKISSRIIDIKKEFDLSMVDVTMDQVKNVIATYFNLDSDFYLDTNQKSELVLARQLTMSFLYKYTKKTKSRIAEYFNQGHANIIHGMKTIENLCETDRKILNYYNDIDYRIVLKYIEK